MKVLLTGGTGFLGKYVQTELVKNKIKYDLYDHKIHGSLVKYENFEKVFFKEDYDCVVHLAAKVGGIGANQKSPYDFISQNLIMGLNVIECVKYHNEFTYREDSPCRIVLVSTVCAYPANTPVPFKEEDLWSGYPEKTNAPYGIAKRTLIEALWAAHEQYGVNSVSLNMANLYGMGDSDDIELNHVIPAVIKKIGDAEQRVFQNYLKCSMNREYYIDTVDVSTNVNLWGDGTPTRDFLHVRDAAKAVVLAAKYKDQGPHFGINIGTGVECSIDYLVKEVCKLKNFNYKKIKWDGSKPNGQIRRCLDVYKAKEILKWRSEIGLLDGLKELCDDRKEIR